MTKEKTQERGAERLKRIQDAYEMKVPDRVPITLNMGYMLARLEGMTYVELEQNPDRALAALEKWALFFQPDSISGGVISGAPNIILGDRMTKWPGHGLPDDRPFQFVEGEYMTADEYDGLLSDPGDFTMRKFMPRVFTELEGLSMLPPIAMMLLAHGSMGSLSVLKSPPVMRAIDVLLEAAQANIDAMQLMMKAGQRMTELGFPPTMDMGSMGVAPFDFVGDTLRGMKGVMMDMYRLPEKLLAAMEKFRKINFEACLQAYQITGRKIVFFPLHRGSDGFMSIEQFETFYWPPLRDFMLDLIDAGMIPTMFYEGIWDDRLHHLAELPKGKTRGMFDRSNMFKVKDVLGDVMPISGGFPVSRLQVGSVVDLRDFTKEWCEVMGRDGGYLMGPSSAMDHCDKDLVKAWVDFTKEYGRY
jgi:hypothetical protein